MVTDPPLYDFCLLTLADTSHFALAEHLLRAVHTYRLPKKIRGIDPSISFSKGHLIVLPFDGFLEESQREALLGSRWLLIMCDPKARDATGVKEAITTFTEFKGHSFILPILLEGEPLSSFPAELFQERSIELSFGDGSQQRITEVIEPLAIDLRGKDFKASLSLLRHARLKIVAALINVSYDTLEQRHEKRLKRRLRTLAALALSIPIALGSFFTYLWFNAQHQIDIVTQKTQLSKDLLAYMCNNYPELFKEIPEAGPLVNKLLLESLEKLRVADSASLYLLPVDELFSLDVSTNWDLRLIQARLLRYLGRVQEASQAYLTASELMDEGKEAFIAASSFFSALSAVDYPSGLWIRDISEESSVACQGLSATDIIVESQGFKFRSLEQFQLHLSSLPPDKIIEIVIFRPDSEGFSSKHLKAKPKDLIFNSIEI